MSDTLLDVMAAERDRALADLRNAKANIRDLQAQLDATSPGDLIAEWMLTMAVFADTETSAVLRDYAVRIRNGEYHGVSQRGR